MTSGEGSGDGLARPHRSESPGSADALPRNHRHRARRLWDRGPGAAGRGRRRDASRGSLAGCAGRGADRRHTRRNRRAGPGRPSKRVARGVRRPPAPRRAPPGGGAAFGSAGSLRAAPGRLGTGGRGDGGRRLGVAAATGPLPSAGLRRSRRGSGAHARAGRAGGRRAALPHGRREPPPRRGPLARPRLRRGPVHALPRRPARAPLPGAGQRRVDLLPPRRRPVGPDPPRVGPCRVRRCHGLHGAPGGARSPSRCASGCAS